MRMLRPICAHWAYASGTDAYCEHTGQELMRALSIRVRNWCVRWAYGSGTDACAEHTGQELMCALSIRVRNWCVHWVYETGTDSCIERTYEICKGPFKTCWAYASLKNMLSIRVRNWCVPWAYASGTDAYAEHTPKELIGAMRVCVRNWCVSSACASEIKWCLAPPKIKRISLYFSPKVTYPERLYGVKIMKIRAIENLTLGHL